MEIIKNFKFKVLIYLFQVSSILTTGINTSRCAKLFHFRSVHYLKLKSGFTLIEILVSVAIVAILGTVISQVFLTSIRTNTKTELLKNVKQNGDSAIGVMSRMIRGAKSVTSACSGTTTKNLTIKNPNDLDTTFGCLSDASVLRIASTSGQTEYLTSSDIELTGTNCNNSSLTFVCTSVGGYKSIKISFTLAQKGTPVSQYEKATGSFTTTVTTRN